MSFFSEILAICKKLLANAFMLYVVNLSLATAVRYFPSFEGV